MTTGAGEIVWVCEKTFLVEAAGAWRLPAEALQPKLTGWKLLRNRCNKAVGPSTTDFLRTCANQSLRADYCGAAHSASHQPKSDLLADPRRSHDYSSPQQPPIADQPFTIRLLRGSLCFISAARSIFLIRSMRGSSCFTTSTTTFLGQILGGLLKLHHLDNLQSHMRSANCKRSNIVMGPHFGLTVDERSLPTVADCQRNDN